MSGRNEERAWSQPTNQPSLVRDNPAKDLRAEHERTDVVATTPGTAITPETGVTAPSPVGHDVVEAVPNVNRPWFRSTLFGILWMLVLGAVVVAAIHIRLDVLKLAKVPGETLHYLGQMFGPPDLKPEMIAKSVAGMLASIQMAWVGTVIAAVLSLPLAFLAASNISPAWIRMPVRLLFDVIRAVPELVLAVLLLTITGLTPWTGALAIGIHSVGTLGKLAAEAIEDAPRGPMEAAEAVGGTWLQRIRVALWPSVAPQVLSVWLYRFEVNVRASAVLGLIGAGGVGALINEYIGFRMFPQIGTVLIVLVIGTVLVDLVSGTVRTALVTGRWPWQNKAKKVKKPVTAH